MGLRTLEYESGVRGTKFSHVTSEAKIPLGVESGC